MLLLHSKDKVSINLCTFQPRGGTFFAGICQIKGNGNNSTCPDFRSYGGEAKSFLIHIYNFLYHCADSDYLRYLLVCVEASVLVESARGAILCWHP